MLKAGDRVDRYVVIGPLGSGGMGEVYQAVDTRLQRHVALKVLALSRIDVPSADSAMLARRMFREARAAAALEHPNIIAIYDVGEVVLGGHPNTYIAMELVRGRGLREALADPAASMVLRMQWLIAVARALAAAHRIGLVHRDIKPENVMIRSDGVVKVLDFGLAKRAEGSMGAAIVTRSVAFESFTREGIAVGTPFYMAPEQMRGEPVDARADQFSWGVVAYEVLTGSRPWTAENDPLRIVAQVLTKPVERPRARAPAIDANVEEALLRTLAKDREERFSSMDALICFLGVEPDSPTSSADNARGVDHCDMRNTEVLSTKAQPSVATRLSVSAKPLSRFSLVVILGSVVAASVFAGAWIGKHAARGGTHFGPSVLHSSCASSRACMTSLGGSPARCRDDGVCVKLASEDCEVLASPAALASDDTVWLGAVFPPKDDSEVDGDLELRAVDLARQDFDQMMSGFADRKDSHARRFGVVGCSNKHGAMRAARHLVDDVRVPAIIGFRSSAEIIDVGSSLLIPSGVLAVPSLTTNPVATTLPSLDGQPRLIWRTAFSSAWTARAMGQVVPQLLEPQVRALPGVVGASKPIRVALLRLKARGGSAPTELIFQSLHFNGKSALEDGGDYRDFVFDGSDAATADTEAKTLVAALDQFAPHVVVLTGDDTVAEKIVIPLEAAWAHKAYRPRWLTILVANPLVRWMGSDPERRHRFYGLVPVASTSVNARFVMHFNESSATKVTRTNSPNASYDAFYLLAYATYAVGDQQPITGPNLARAFGRLVPPGKKIEVGTSGIYEAYAALRRGENIDVEGAYGSLDFDLATGEVPFDQALVCVGLDDLGHAAEHVESGVVYRAATNKLEGTLHCP